MPALALAHDFLNLAQRIVLPLDRQGRRRASEIDRVDRSLYLRRNGSVLSAGGNPGGGPKGFATRKANAYQAYWENHAIRANPPVKGAMRIYRTIDWGGLARF